MATRTEVYVCLDAFDWFAAPPDQFTRNVVVRSPDGTERPYCRLCATFLGYIAQRIEFAFERGLSLDKLGQAIQMFNEIRQASGIWDEGNPPGNYRKPRVPKIEPSVYDKKHPADPWVGVLGDCWVFGLDKDGRPVLPIDFKEFAEKMRRRDAKTVRGNRGRKAGRVNRKGGKVLDSGPQLF